MIDKQNFRCVQWLFDERRESTEGVFYENEHQKNHDRYPEFWFLDQRELLPLGLRRAIVLPCPNNAYPDQRRDGRASDRRQRRRDLLAAFQRSLRLLLVIRLSGRDGREHQQACKKQKPTPAHCLFPPFTKPV